MTLPILYSFRRCPYAMRARLALLVSGTVCELREVVLRDKPPEMLAASPKGTVPVLILPCGRVIDESLDIMHWALGQNDPECWLAGDDSVLIARNDGPFKHHLDRMKYAVRYGSDPMEHRAAAMTFLFSLETLLTAHPCLTGSQRTLTDMAIFPFIRQFAEVDRTWFDAQPLPALQQWLAHHLASDLFQRAMVRPARWQAGDAPVTFPG